MGNLIGEVAGNEGENLHCVGLEIRLGVQWGQVEIGRFAHHCPSRGKMLQSVGTAT